MNKPWMECSIVRVPMVAVWSLAQSRIGPRYSGIMPKVFEGQFVAWCTDHHCVVEEVEDNLGRKSMKCPNRAEARPIWLEENLQ